MSEDTLRTLRVLSKKSFAEVAQVLGITLRKYSRYEQGEELVSVEQVFTLAKLYRVSPGAIVNASISPWAESPQLNRLREEERPINNKRLYRVFCNMKQRCYNPHCPDFKEYGERGISICNYWRRNFAAFRAWAMKNGYDENAKYGECTIDRIDVNGNYAPSNCRWVSMVEQNQNRRNMKIKHQ